MKSACFCIFFDHGGRQGEVRQQHKPGGRDGANGLGRREGDEAQVPQIEQYGQAVVYRWHKGTITFKKVVLLALDATDQSNSMMWKLSFNQSEPIKQIIKERST